MNVNLIFEFTIIAGLICGNVLDIYSYMIRSEIAVSGSSQIIGLSNWVQYLARIANMVSIFAFAFLLENGSFKFNVVHIFTIAMFFSFFLSLSLIKFQKMKYLPYFMQRLGFAGVFGGIGRRAYWVKIEFITRDTLVFFSVIVSVLYILALLTPLLLSTYMPHMRMTLAYTGQFLNFAASILVFTYIDRKSFKLIDEKKALLAISCVISGKVYAQFILLIALLIINALVPA